MRVRLKVDYKILITLVFIVPANYRNTLSFKGMLSPASSSLDSLDVKMNSPPAPLYENTGIFMESSGTCSLKFKNNSFL